ncbi:hypothetical protein NW754_005658 [Fusarium falciforme]|nr:hypothetical protein NW754_005658 [Fusarium falciforme]
MKAGCNLSNLLSETQVGTVVFGALSKANILPSPYQIHRTITSPSEWDEIVKIAGDQSLEHFCFITKRHSWSRILITRELLLRIISHYSIFLSFLRLVRLFGARLSEGNPSGGFFYRTWSAEPFSSSDDSLHKPCTGYELHYTLRYVEKHSRNMKIPWSMRQMAVCHRANIDNQFSSWILVHAGHDLKESLCARTDEYLSDGVEDRAATVHLTILHFAARNWSAYLDYLSSEFKQISDRARNCKVIKAKPGEDDEFEIGIQDMQWLQWLAEHLLITKHNLAENSHTINGLGQYLKRPKAVKRQGKEDHGHDGLACGEFPMWVAAWKDETRSNLDTLQTLMGQVRECTQLVRF